MPLEQLKCTGQHQMLMSDQNSHMLLVEPQTGTIPLGKGLAVS